MLRYDPKTGLSVDDITTVREVVRQDWVEAFQRDGDPALDTEPETPAGQLIDSQTAHIVEKDNEILFLGNQFNPITAEGIWQDALGKIYFLSRKREQPSVAVCTCMGLEGTVIAEGSVIRSTVDRTMWTCQEAVTIPASGEVEAVFVCSKTGPIAAAAGTLTDIVSVLTGWDSVNNKAAATIGRDVETQMEFEQRRYDSVAVNARGSLSSLYAAIGEIDGVLDALVLENQGSEPLLTWGVEIPGHSVYISVVGGDDEEIAAAIYRKKDAGCGTAGNTTVTYQDTVQPGLPVYQYQIERPETLPVRMRVVVRRTQSTPSTVDTLIKSAIMAEFSGKGPHGTPRVGMAQTVYSSRFFCSVVEVAKITSLESIDISTEKAPEWSDNITIMADQNPVLDEADITVELI